MEAFLKQFFMEWESALWVQRFPHK
jgi:hypothetical protein